MAYRVHQRLTGGRYLVSHSLTPGLAIRYLLAEPRRKLALRWRRWALRVFDRIWP